MNSWQAGLIRLLLFVLLAALVPISNQLQKAFAGNPSNWSSQTRKAVTITNNSSTASIPVGYTITVNVTGLDATAGTDLHVVYWNGTTNTEINRDYETDAATSSNYARFETQAAIAASTTDNTSYWIYYGSTSNPGAPLATLSNVYQHYSDFTGSQWDSGFWGTIPTCATTGASGVTFATVGGANNADSCNATSSSSYGTGYAAEFTTEETDIYAGPDWFGFYATHHVAFTASGNGSYPNDWSMENDNGSLNPITGPSFNQNTYYVLSVARPDSTQTTFNVDFGTPTGNTLDVPTDAIPLYMDIDSMLEPQCIPVCTWDPTSMVISSFRLRLAMNPEPSVASLSAALLTNTGYETGSNSSWTTNCNISPSIQSTTKHGGTYAAQFICGSTWYEEQSTTLAANTTYVLGVYAQADNAVGCQYGLGTSSTLSSDTLGTMFPLTSSWTGGTSTFTTSAAGTYYVGIVCPSTMAGGTGNAYIYLDDWCLGVQWSGACTATPLNTTVANTNLFNDPGFENSTTTGWLDQVGEGSTETTTVHSGTKAWYEADSHSSTYIEQQLYLVGGNTYTAGAYIDAPTNGGCQIGYGASGTLTSDNLTVMQQVTAGTWTYVADTFTPSSTSSEWVGIICSGGSNASISGTVSDTYFDDTCAAMSIAFVCGGSTTWIKQGTSNLFTNPGFESGDSQWFTVLLTGNCTAANTSTKAHSGTYSESISGSSCGADNWSQTMLFVQGITYTLSGWAYYSTSNKTVNCNAGYYTMGTLSIGTFGPQVTLSKGTWAQMTFTFTWSKASANMYAGIYCSTTTGNTVYADDFSLTGAALTATMQNTGYETTTGVPWVSSCTRTIQTTTFHSGSNAAQFKTCSSSWYEAQGLSLAASTSYTFGVYAQADDRLGCQYGWGKNSNLSQDTLGTIFPVTSSWTNGTMTFTTPATAGLYYIGLYCGQVNASFNYTNISVYLDDWCFSTTGGACASVALNTSPTNTNLFANNGFETGNDLGWGHNTLGGYSVQSTTKHSGTYAWNDSVRGINASMEQQLYLVGGSTYTENVYVDSASNAGCQFAYGPSIDISTGTKTTLQPVPAATWTLVADTFIPPATGSYWVGFICGDAGGATFANSYFDDTCIAMTNTTACNAATSLTESTSNLYVDPGFEANSSTWDYKGNCTVTNSTTVAHSGTHSEQASGTASCTQSFSQDIALINNYKYTLTGWAELSGSNPVSCQMGYNTSSDDLSSGTLSSSTSLTATWQQLSYTFIYNGAHTDAFVGMYCPLSWTSGTVTMYADDFSITASAPLLNNANYEMGTHTPWSSNCSNTPSIQSGKVNSGTYAAQFTCNAQWYEEQSLSLTSGTTYVLGVYSQGDDLLGCQYAWGTNANLSLDTLGTLFPLQASFTYGTLSFTPGSTATYYVGILCGPSQAYSETNAYVYLDDWCLDVSGGRCSTASLPTTAANTNLFAGNPGFENGNMYGWLESSGSATGQHTTVNSGSIALQDSGSYTSSPTFSLEQQLYLTGGNTYTIGAYLNVPTAMGCQFGYGNNSDLTQDTLTTLQSPTVATWTYTAGTFTPGSSASAWVGIICGGGPTNVYIDDTCLAMTNTNACGTATSLTQSTGVNLFTNPGFETGLSPWGLGSCSETSVTSPVHSGTHASESACGDQQYAVDAESIALIHGYSYSVSGWGYGFGSGIDCLLETFSSIPVFMGPSGVIESGSDPTLTANTWTQVTLSFTYNGVSGDYYTGIACGYGGGPSYTSAADDLSMVATAPVGGTGTLTGVNWSVDNNQTSHVSSRYEYNFTTATSGSISTVTMTVPSGTVGASLTVQEHKGLGAGTAALAGTTVTYTVTSPVTIPANIPIRIVLSGFTNTGTGGSNTSTITTNNGGTAIDQGTSNSITFGASNTSTGLQADARVGTVSSVLTSASLVLDPLTNKTATYTFNVTMTTDACTSWSLAFKDGGLKSGSYTINPVTTNGVTNASTWPAGSDLNVVGYQITSVSPTNGSATYQGTLSSSTYAGFKTSSDTFLQGSPTSGATETVTFTVTVKAQVSFATRAGLYSDAPQLIFIPTYC